MADAPATYADKIRLTRSNYVQQLLDLSNPAKRKPNYSVGGRSFSWADYRKFLSDEIRSLTSLLALLDPDAPGELITAIE